MMYAEPIVERIWMAHGLRCLAVLNVETGFRCGYVAVPSKHPKYKVHYDSVDVEVHGGLTFGGEHPYLNNAYCFGFDCGHYGDAPEIAMIDNKEMRKILQSHGKPHGKVRKLDYVVKECEKLAKQLSGMIHKNQKSKS